LPRRRQCISMQHDRHHNLIDGVELHLALSPAPTEGAPRRELEGEANIRSGCKNYGYPSDMTRNYGI
jgi:hypothetical protein